MADHSASATGKHSVLPSYAKFKTIPADYPWFINFDFEKNFDHMATLMWFQKYWQSAFLISGIYLILVFAGKRYMKNRPRFELYWPLTLWSSSLAIYSWYCVFRAWGEFIYMVRRYGWHSTACDPIGYTSIPGFWVFIFVLSKLVEFGDTAFIVLRKQKLIFLHWYHHITVFIYAWYSYGQIVAPARYFIFVNVNVHAIMYTYYAAKASKLVRIPRNVNIFITTFQTTQMFVGIMVNCYALLALSEGVECSINRRNIFVSFLMYSTYLILFTHYFYKTYYSENCKDISVQPTERDASSIPGASKRFTNGLNAGNGEAKKEQ